MTIETTKASKPETYECAACGGVFEKGWSDEEAEDEVAATFPGHAMTECALVCDDCYRQMGYGDADQ
jgi:hypothetical protein